MSQREWDSESDGVFVRTFAKHSSMREALAELSGIFGGEVSRHAVDRRFAKMGIGTAQQNLGVSREPKAGLNVPAAKPSGPRLHDRFEPLVELAKRYRKKGGLSLETLCDELEMSPSKVRSLVEDARDEGYSFEIHHDELSLGNSNAPLVDVPVDDAPEMPGEEIVLGVVSDPHIGSKHHERDALDAHMNNLAKRGVKHVIGPGDWMPGGYRFLKHEVTRTGIEDQAELVKDRIQSFGRDFIWHAIAGNHDESFDVGIDGARMVARQMAEDGWTNFRYYGARAARIILHGAKIGLHHPGGGLSYAISYKLQKYVDAIAPVDRPDLLFTGHTHQALHLRRGGVHAFLCGTFENGDSSFGRMLGGDVALGSWVIRFTKSAAGKMSVAGEFLEYPQRRMVYVKAG